MKKILITGSNGYLAKNFQNYLKDFDLYFVSRENLNLLDTFEVDNFFKKNYFDIILHTAVVGGKRLFVDDYSIVHQNYNMHLNILKNQEYYGKYISFGSGAELDRSKNIDENSLLLDSFPKDPYGMSKNIIAKSGLLFDKFYNLRIFNVFNENELSTRMIKSSINNYIQRNNILIHQDKFMDFIHFEDLLKIVLFYIENNECPKTINCCYENKYLLSDIAKIINNLTSYQVDIIIEEKDFGNSYIGKYQLDSLGIKTNNLEQRILDCYKLLSS